MVRLDTFMAVVSVDVASVLNDGIAYKRDKQMRM